MNKLLWRQQSGSEKQWRDVLGILKVQFEDLDFDHLKQWAGQMGVVNVLSQALTESGI